jgi:hypothetical protein
VTLTYVSAFSKKRARLGVAGRHCRRRAWTSQSDLTGSYSLAFWLSIASSAFSAISIWRAARRGGHGIAPRAAMITDLINC